MKLLHSKIFARPNGITRPGAAIVEFAFVAPLLALVLMGMMELSRGLMVKVMLSDAARKGCRTGIQRDKANSDIINDCTSTMRDNNFNSTKFNPNGIGSVTVTVTDPSGTPLPDTRNAPTGSIVSVQVSIPISSTTWVPSVFLRQGSMESETVVMMKQ